MKPAASPTQPPSWAIPSLPISRMIADLEDAWGVKLLTRNRSGIEISSEGLVLLPKLQAICKDYEDLNYAISEIHGLSSGSIRVGAFSSISSGLAAPDDQVLP